MDMSAIELTNFGSMGIFATVMVTVATVIWYYVLKPTIEKLIGHAFDEDLEEKRIEGVLIEKRYETALSAANDLAQMFSEIVEELDELKNSEDHRRQPKDSLMNQLHEEYRRKYRIIRSRFELTNDLLSRYSILFDQILHPDSIKSIWKDSHELTSPSDYRYAYRTIWSVVLASLNSVLRVGSHFKFWDPIESYGSLAEEWANRDRDHVRSYLIEQFSVRPRPDYVFQLRIEESTTLNEFLEGLRQKRGMSGAYRTRIPKEPD